MRVRKKPVEVEAVEWTGHNIAEVAAFLAPMAGRWGVLPELVIETLEGAMQAQPGDFIIRGVAGEFYPCKPGIFWQTYEVIE